MKRFLTNQTNILQGVTDKGKRPLLVDDLSNNNSI